VEEADMARALRGLLFDIAGWLEGLFLRAWTAAELGADPTKAGSQMDPLG
jgi:hypothetical protein